MKIPLRIYISSITITKETWKILQNTHKGVEKIRKAHFKKHRREVQSLNMKETNSSISNYFSIVLAIVNLLKKKWWKFKWHSCDWKNFNI